LKKRGTARRILVLGGLVALMVSTVASPAAAQPRMGGYCEEGRFAGQGFVYYHDEGNKTWIDKFDATQYGGGKKTIAFVRTKNEVTGTDPWVVGNREYKIPGFIKNGKTGSWTPPASILHSTAKSANTYTWFRFRFDKSGFDAECEGRTLLF
jgi:hypothetical protein